jgi:hypothetical protein
MDCTESFRTCLWLLSWTICRCMSWIKYMEQEVHFINYKWHIYDSDDLLIKYRSLTDKPWEMFIFWCVSAATGWWSQWLIMVSSDIMPFNVSYDCHFKTHTVPQKSEGTVVSGDNFCSVCRGKWSYNNFNCSLEFYYMSFKCGLFGLVSHASVSTQSKQRYSSISELTQKSEGTPQELILSLLL